MSSASESPSTPAVEQATPRADAPAAGAPEPPHQDTPGLARRIAGKQLRPVSPNVIITLVGGLLTGLLLWQLNALGDNIDGLRTDMQTEIGGLRSEIGALRTDMQGQIGALRTDMQTEIGALRTDMQTEIGALRTDMQTEIGALRSEIGALRTDMQDGFRDIYEILLDHTDRLARLESTSDVNG